MTSVEKFNLLNQFKESLYLLRKSRNTISGDGSISKMTINSKGKGLIPYRPIKDIVDYRRINPSAKEAKDELVDRRNLTDKIRAELLQFIGKLLRQKEIKKYFNQGLYTRDGIFLTDSPAPQAFDFMIQSIANFVFLTIGIPDEIFFAITTTTSSEDSPKKILLASNLGYLNFLFIDNLVLNKITLI